MGRPKARLSFQTAVKFLYDCHVMFCDTEMLVVKNGAQCFLLLSLFNVLSTDIGIWCIEPFNS